MRIEFTYTRKADHLSGFAAPRGRKASTVLSYVVAAMFGLAGAVAAVQAVTTGDSSTTGPALFCVLVGAGIAVAVQQRGRTATPAISGTALEPLRWVITEESIEITHANRSASLMWPAFQTMMTLPHAYVFLAGNGTDRRMIDVPREPLSEADDTAIRELADRHGIVAHSRPIGA